MIVLFVTVGMPLVGAPPPALYLLLGVALLVTGYHALKAWRDLQSGVALVREDVLERSARARSRGPGKFSGRFSELGRLRMTSQSYVQGQPGLRHRVVYSPASRLVWSAEPLGGLEALLASYEHEP